MGRPTSVAEAEATHSDTLIVTKMGPVETMIGVPKSNSTTGAIVSMIHPGKTVVATLPTLSWYSI